VTATLPSWLSQLASALPGITVEQISQYQPPPGTVGRESAVLVCFGDTDGRPDLVLTQRPTTLPDHPGQVAFPGGATDPEDGGSPVTTALREALEEVELDPSTVTVFGQLPGLWLRASNFVAVPVLAWWHTPHALVPNPHEVEAIARIPLASLADPQNRVMVRHSSGYEGVAFDVLDPVDPARRWFVWGFTANVVDHLLAFGGWEVPWDRSRTRPLPV
jgi:8-oxo-dGTP pyrophosphatase MutT (NUDIX family)